MNSLGDVLFTARRARGLTQEEVAERAGITQAALSRYENGMRIPSAEVVAELARVLDVTSILLERASRVRGAMAVDVHMRRRRTAPPTAWRRLEAKLNMYRLHSRQLLEEVGLRTEHHVPTFDPFETSAAEAARLVRMQWRMPIGPVRGLVRWLEAAGCLVLEENFGTKRVDGLSQWIDDHPIMLLNATSPTDRKRLTAAHELAHLCLHTIDISSEVEAEANGFAAEFLTPAETIRPQLRNLTLGKLHDLKREWGVSMQALIERAYELGTLPAAKRTSLYKRLSALGWRASEPLSDQLPTETPALARYIGDELARRGLSTEEIAQLAGFGTDSTDNPFEPAARSLRSV